MRSVILPAFCALAACQPAPEREVDPQPEASGVTSAADPAAPSIPAPATIVGEYRVAGLDGEAFESQTGIAVSITDTTISYEPTCLGYSWDYEYDGGVLSLEPTPGTGPEVRDDGTTVTCLVYVDPEYGELGRAVAAATRVDRTPENGLRFSGGGRSFTLFSQ